MAAYFPLFGGSDRQDCARMPDDDQTSGPELTFGVDRIGNAGNNFLCAAWDPREDDLIFRVYKNKEISLQQYVERWDRPIDDSTDSTYGDVAKSAFKAFGDSLGFKSWVARVYSHKSEKESVFPSARVYSINIAMQAESVSACSFYFFTDSINALDAKFTLVDMAKFIEEYYPEDNKKSWDVFLCEVIESYIDEVTDFEREALVRHALDSNNDNLLFWLLGNGVCIEPPEKQGDSENSGDQEESQPSEELVSSSPRILLESQNPLQEIRRTSGRINCDLCGLY